MTTRLGWSLLLAMLSFFPMAAFADEVPSALKLESGSERLEVLKTDQVLVVVAYGVGCPVLRQNIPGFLALERAFGKTARFIYIDGNPQDTDEKVREEAKTYGLEGRIGMDRDQKWLRTFGLGTVGEAAVAQRQKDGSFKVVYRGGISDRVNFDRALPKPRKEFLKSALREIAAGKTVTRATAPTFGCAITFK